MGKVAFLFPGQGSQAVGMGQALHGADASCAALFEEANTVLGEDLRGLMFDGPEADLTLTRNTQPALVVTAMAAYTLLRQQSDLQADFVAGHSLGEYAAICAAGGLSFADAIRLTRLRGDAMQKAVPVGVGAMAAMLNMEAALVEEVCQAASQALGQVCVPANYNTPAQIVISGDKAAVEHAVALAKERGAKRCVMLSVSAPFHCPLMQPAADAMAQALAQTPMQDLSIPLVANVNAGITTDAETVRQQLVAQVCGSVRWEASIRAMIAQGVDRFVEIGTGKVLTGMLKRIDGSVRGVAVNGPEDMAALAELL
ncbi:[Acyl-carrier-protein] S-malonyltransferase [Magnetococcus marinus MC-1]|uniref:Malonyl CoA-acyl carrier protein transacylase n=1 Tax=Magnetococcus marinus (strain ATCC BAA-1437 / JCM 17883 / MC-1) TaxID=156889 RepID=A0L8U0_MAGMM|nr:ACP S-malonyltransferase [Magnetococcus marinus]ABK44383.1 [Acyl-carrier-protein] S-malonyltransferase [Magnetococcus marinus MC-1]